ncbi:MAG: hypothetical protein CL927_03900 [Deltaproteobacteria bacterium]|nr:hypothetical protein [Deltaproteobacteria bacterium]HCH61866.1 hypothetical protein [Deltaproteobacteria bacterium]
MSRVLITALYKFVPLHDHVALRAPILARAEAAGIRGTLLLAAEGINGTIAGPEEGLRSFLTWLREDARLADLMHKESWTDDMPFLRLKVKLKKEIVTMGVPGINPNTRVGTYVKPTDWNALISDPSVVLIDTRNDYEVEIGTFRGAVDPNTESFTDFPAWSAQAKELQGKTRVAMFCTGGIRCEKASAYLLSQGVEEVYHLEGGILKYLEEVPKTESLWEGECFVFDRRVSVDHDLKPGRYSMCAGCRRAVSPEARQSPQFLEGVSCPACYDRLTDDQRERFAERHLQLTLARTRGQTFWGRRPEEHPAPSTRKKPARHPLPILYSFRRCPYAMRARMALRAAAIPVEIREVVLRDKPPHMLELSPKGTVPVLWLSDNTVIDESRDIMMWALQRKDPEAWWPNHPDALRDALALIDRNDHEFKHHLDRYKYATRYEGAVAVEHRTAAEAFFANLEQRLSEKPFLSGLSRGFLDAAIMPFVRQFANTDRSWFDAAPYPHLQAWLAQELASPSFTEVMTKYPQWSGDGPGVRFPAGTP